MPTLAAVSSGLKRRAGIDVLGACAHAQRMGKKIQIRNVPEALRHRPNSRAALRPTVAELRGRLEGRSEAALSLDAADAVREERDRR